jgi:hypothetical protein
MYQEQGPIACLLMRKLKPRWWCQFGNAGVYSHPSTRPVEFAHKHLPEMYTAHPNLKETSVVLWGTSNHIYIDNSVHSDAHRVELGRAGAIPWIVDNIIGSYPEDLGTASQALCPVKLAIESKTNFVLHNLPSLERCPDDIDTDPKSHDTVHLDWEQALLTELHRASGRPISYWSRLVSVLPQVAYDICPRCDTDCRGR